MEKLSKEEWEKLSKEERNEIKKQRRKQWAWARNLSRNLVSNIVELDPINIKFEIERDTYGAAHTICEIKLENGAIGIGVATCSLTEKFNERKGRNIAAGRALKALINKHNCIEVRLDGYEDFPGYWSRRRIERVMDTPYTYRSNYLTM